MYGRTVFWDTIPSIGCDNTIRGGPAMAFAGSGKPLTQRGLDAAAGIVDIPMAAMWAVIQVESSGAGYLDDRRPKILFERHKFSHATGGRFDDSHPGISNPV